MSTTLLVILISVAIVGFFVVALSLTQMIKGHPIQSEISTNPHMKERGIKCAMQQEREAQLEAMGKDSCESNVDCNGECSACGAVDYHHR
ncbi:MAG: hypothetical protein J6V28_05435 [Tidjanibacter sp.]|jgi:uncharacterized protein YneF (UPF0154 family)|nr:hypothetical protein [Tidjanibacter sp.]MBQ2247264.1 hypothetical protein [Tidjanibacter sp.]